MSGGRRILDFTGSRTASDTLIVLEFMATLGNAEMTDLKIDLFEWTDCQIPRYISTFGGNFSLSDLCKSGGVTRLYDYEGVPLGLTFMPNPVNENASVDFNLSESGNTSLCIYDNLGRIVKELHRGFTDKGAYNVKFSTDEINTGIYYIVLKTEREVITKTMGVQK